MGIVRRQLLFTPFAQRLFDAFPGSAWLSTLDLDQGLVSTPDVFIAPRPKSVTLAVIGGTKFDEQKLEAWLRALPSDTVIVTGDGRGAEETIVRLSKELGLRVDVPSQEISPRPLQTRRDMLARIDQAIAYGQGKTKGLDLQIESILVMTSGTVVLVGEGGRVKKAQKWLKRAKWNREVECL